MISLSLPWTVEIHSPHGLEADFGVAYIHNDRDALEVAKAITALLDFPKEPVIHRQFVDRCGADHLYALLDIAKELPPQFWVRILDPSGEPVHEGLSRLQALLDGGREIRVARVGRGSCPT